MGRSGVARASRPHHIASGTSSRLATALSLGLVAALVGACSGSDDATTTSTTVAVVESVDATRPDDDGRLSVGLLLPITGPASELATGLRAGIDLAVDEIDATGAFEGDVRVVAVDEAMLDGGIPPSVEEIFGEPVDAIVGPASSLLAARLLPVTVPAGVMTCSPTASALSLDGFPDPSTLFVRTIPSDSLQARALASRLDGTGADIVLAYVDDAFGRPLLEQVQSELDSLGAPLVGTVAFDPTDTDYTDTAADIVASGAATIGIIGDPEAGPRLVQALAEAIDPTRQTSIWMNDAMRVPASAGIYRRLDPDVLSLLRGVSPRSSVEPAALAGEGVFFAANAYDCMNVIALAATAAGATDGRSMAAQIPLVTTGGTSCTSYQQCSNELEAGRGIDYDGPTGALDIGADGDPITGSFDTYAFDTNGTDVTLAAVPLQV